MLHDLVRWLLHSPRRLAMATLPLAALAVLLAVQTSAPSPSKEVGAGPTPAGEPSTAPASRPATASARSEQPASAGEVQATARRFLDLFVVARDSGDPRDVPAQLKAVTTPALWSGLRLTSPAELPRGVVREIDLPTLGAFSGTVDAELDTGVELSLTVVAWETGWRVSDVRRSSA